ncbi:MAG: four helix bundle protein [Phycisphaerae bacterium]|nr:four helix bundle protein [Phycisphaerae bacterium]
MQDFRELRVWQRARGLTVQVYRATAPFPKDEMFGLTSQMRRAAVSIVANIAEGCGRDGSAEFARFLHMAAGSASELASHLILAGDLHYLMEKVQQPLLDEAAEIQRMLTVLIQRVKQAPSRSDEPLITNNQQLTTSAQRGKPATRKGHT